MAVWVQNRRKFLSHIVPPATASSFTPWPSCRLVTRTTLPSPPMETCHLATTKMWPMRYDMFWSVCLGLDFNMPEMWLYCRNRTRTSEQSNARFYVRYVFPFFLTFIINMANDYSKEKITRERSVYEDGFDGRNAMFVWYMRLLLMFLRVIYIKESKKEEHFSSRVTVCQAWGAELRTGVQVKVC